MEPHEFSRDVLGVAELSNERDRDTTTKS